MFERFTEKSRRSLFFARYTATQLRSSVMQPEHLLEGVLEASPTSVSDAATTVELIRQRLSMTIMESQERPTLHEIIFSSALKRVLQNAAAAADRLGHRPIRPEHLLLALLDEPRSSAAQALQFAQVDRETLEQRAGRSDEQVLEPKAPAKPHEANPAHTFSIQFDLTIAAPMTRVFEGVSTPAGLDHWWTRRATGSSDAGATLDLDFGPGYEWQAVVRRTHPPRVFELEMTGATDEWRGTRVGFEIGEHDGHALVHFHHEGWSAVDDHFRTTAYNWAMYLRLLRRYLEHGETVPYDRRLDV